MVVLLSFSGFLSTAQSDSSNTQTQQLQRMKVEIWSDVVCPFCYIGKRHFETALAQFEHREQVEIVWKSFQLDPETPYQADSVNLYQYLADRKGISYEQSVSMHENVTEMARKAGLEYHFEKAHVANTFKAHCLIQLATEKGLDSEMEEALFNAHFTRGKHIGSEEVLIELGTEIGLSESDIQAAFTDDRFAQKVLANIAEARQLGVNGVPFFVFNRTYALSGAQPPEQFLNVLEKAFEEMTR